jgi:hypothetical protein
MSVPFRRRVLRFIVIFSILMTALMVLTSLERRRIRASATSPSAAAQPGPITGRSLMDDIERLASPQFEGRRTGTAGSHAAQDFIVERLTSLGAVPAFESYRQPFSFTRTSIRGLLSPSQQYKTEYPDATNIGAIIRGTSRPERFLVLSAHYDHFGIRDGQLFPGADDNASGVAVMLGVARVLSQQPLRHSVILLAFDAEELGLRGARHFVEHPPVDLSLIDVVVNLDMVARGDENILVAAGTSHHPSLEAPVRVAASGRSLQVVFGHDRPHYKAGQVENWTHASDHGPFHDAGVPFVYFGVEDHDDYHRATDTADKIPVAFLGEVGNFTLSAMRQLDSVRR